MTWKKALLRTVLSLLVIFLACFPALRFLTGAWWDGEPMTDLQSSYYGVWVCSFSAWFGFIGSHMLDKALKKRGW